MKNERTKVWIDDFQTKLFARIGVYLLVFLLCLGNLLFIWRLLEEGPGDPLEQYSRVFTDFAPAGHSFA